jgi:hypothetical protein
MARQAPSADRLRRFADEHLLYEPGMLHALTVKLMNRHHREDPVLENALLASFGIHSRNLIDFFWNGSPMKDTDAIASDYVADWKAPAISERLSQVKDRVGKEMVHLSYNRLNVERKGWQVLGIGPEITAAFGAFAVAVPADRVRDGWHEAAWAAIGSVPPERAQEMEKHFISAADVRPEDLVSASAASRPAGQATQWIWGPAGERLGHPKAT